MQQIYEPILSFLKEYGKDLKAWMKFWIINIVFMMTMLFVFDVDVNKMIDRAFEREVVEMYIQPERVSEIEKILASTTAGCEASGAYVFAYLPMYAIKSSTLLQIYEPEGVNYLNFEQYTNVPVTIDGDWFLKMKAQELYHRELSKEGVYGNMHKRGVRHFYSYPITGKNNILYGNLTVVFNSKPVATDATIKEYLKVATENIVRNLEL